MIHNPILPGFNPDPCIIRVKDDYYIATSSFEWFPSIPIYHSRDLKHWHVLTHAITERRVLDLRMIESAKGVWAPDLYYDERRQTFMITYTRMASMNGRYFDLDNYLIESENIMGPWSDPIYLNSVGFDPSMFRDTDGRYYVVSLQWEWREGYEVPGTIVLQEYDAVHKKTIGYAKTISTGATDRGCIEAPRIYKRGEFYYLMLAEGGTGYGHSVTLSRSKSIWGPYEGRTDSPIVTSHIDNFYDRNNPDSLKIERYKENGTYLQKSGHGSICTGQNGEVYLCHLCSRPFLPELRCSLGRETAIQKMQWTEDGWLEMADGSNLAKESVEEPKGLDAVVFPREEGRVCFQPWPEYLIGLRIERKGWCTVNEHGYAVMRGQQSLCSLDRVSFIGRQLRSIHAQCETRVAFDPEVFQHAAGLSLYYDNMNHVSLLKTIEKGQLILKIVQLDNGQRTERAKIPLDERGVLDLRCTINGKQFFFSYKSATCAQWTQIPTLFDTTMLSDEYSNFGEFTGTFCGMYVMDSAQKEKQATFHYFAYQDQNPCDFS